MNNIHDVLSGENREPTSGLVFKAVKAVICSFDKEMQISSDEVPSQETLIDELGIDSRTRFMIVDELNDEFGITIPDRVTFDFVSVGDIVEFILGALAKMDGILLAVTLGAVYDELTPAL